MNGNEEASNWDSLLADLGLDSASKSAGAPPSTRAHVPSPPKPVKPPAPPFEPTFRKEVFEVPARASEIEMEGTAPADDAEPSDFGAGIVEDGADVLDDESPEGTEGAAEGQAEGDGKGRRRRRRRRRKKGAPGDAAVAEGAVPAVPELSIEGEELGVAESRDEAATEIGAPVAEIADEDDEVEEIVPEFSGVEEEMEDDSTEPLPEWKVTAWTELVATLYRPQNR